VATSWRRCRDGAARRSATARRLTTWRVRPERIGPPLIRLSGQRPSPEAKAAAWGKLGRSGPTSDHKVWAVKLFTPGTAVRSTPKIRYR
jgi:hypothetical protein